MINNKQFDLNNIECVRDIAPETAVSYSGGASGNDTLGMVLFGTAPRDGKKNSKIENFVFAGRFDRNSEGKRKLTKGGLFFTQPNESDA